ncbi:hypothetical protein [Mangrovibacterium sp.]|uniref:hypothetical protein n=1 Tax=Mangrovibacterium sp. TaxID=1961364 RepID=UPI0035621491
MTEQIVNKKKRLKTEKLTFVEYCDSLKDKQKEPFEEHTPLDKLFNAIADATGKHPGSVRRWYYGTAKPGKLEMQAMATLLKSDVATLFPCES